jgi:hypothetical protein
MTSNVLRDHVRRCLETSHAYNQAIDAVIADFEATGHRVVTNYFGNDGEWKVSDSRTGEILARGRGDDGVEVCNRLDPCHLWIAYEHVFDCVPIADTPAVGLPQPLGNAIEEWAENPSTTDEEIAMVADWPVEKVQDLRRADDAQVGNASPIHTNQSGSDADPVAARTQPAPNQEARE